MRQRGSSTIKHITGLICLALALLFTAGCVFMPGQNDNTPQTADKVTVGSFTDNKNGTISFSYNNTNKKTCKVVTQLEGGRMYQYGLPSGQCDLVFPLSQGNGTYHVYLCINTSGNKYSVIESMSIDLDIDDAESVFLCSNYIINWNTENEAIKKAYELTDGITDEEEKIIAIYDYMVKNFSYDYDKMEGVNDGTVDKAYVPDTDTTYAAKMGICYDISSLTAAMLRSVSVPAKVVTGYSSNTVSYHAWNSVYRIPRKEWRTMDLTYDIQMYQDGYRYSMYKSDEYYSDILYFY